MTESYRKPRVAIVLLGLALLVVPSLPAANVETFVIDRAHSSVGFKIRHLVANVAGRFGEFSGSIQGDRKNPGIATVTFTINASSVDTGMADRDKHLRGPDFFDVENFPEITFTSVKVTAKGKDRYDTLGNLTMHGVTKSVILPVEFHGIAKDPWGSERAGFSIAMKLDRKEWGISWNKALDQGGAMLGDEVSVSIEIEAVKKADELLSPGTKPASGGRS